jgi:tetratricopeptide (TPR) repeat protein
MTRLNLLLCLAAAFAACRPIGPAADPRGGGDDQPITFIEAVPGPPGAPIAEAVSFLGDTLHRPRFPAATQARLESDYDSAMARLQARPDDADAWIWVGRRAGYLGAHQRAIAVFTLALDKFPNDPRLYRHRGHRYISTRRLDYAIADFERAVARMEGRPDEIEPDGQPNARNIPIGSLQSNVWYHLALAHYLKGDWDEAVRAARSGITVSSNPDRLVSQTHWLYMALRRGGRDAEAAAAVAGIRDDYDIIENDSYYRLVKMYRDGVSRAAVDSVLGAPGAASPSDASFAYGLANWLLYSGDTARATRAFERILGGGSWASFGYIAAEADLARLR